MLQWQEKEEKEEGNKNNHGYFPMIVHGLKSDKGGEWDVKIVEER